MNPDQLRGQWKNLKGKAKEHWGKLTDDELTKAEGKKDQLIGLLQEKYGYAKDQAEQEYNKWEKEIEQQFKSKK